MEPSASFEARYAPLPYPTNQVLGLDSSSLPTQELRAGWMELPVEHGFLKRYRIHFKLLNITY